MFVVPLSTDAPLYHIPWVTGTIIVSNTVIFFATVFQVMIGNMEWEQIEWLMIEFNNVNPIQWITGSFMHAGIGHLVGNMLVLFSFGIIVEGKIGNARFAAIYLALCLGTGAITQIPMYLMGDDTVALGASAAIAGIVVIALIWAPENEVTVFYWIAIVFYGVTEFRVITLALFSIAFDLLIVIFSGFVMTGAMAHTLGSLLGIPIGVYYLRTCKVDCEGWDVISRNEWLQQYDWLYGEKQKQRDRNQEDEVMDPIGTALELSGATTESAKKLGLSVPRPQYDKPRKLSAPVKKQSKQGKGLHKHKQPVSPVAVREQECQAHPDFNRLAFVLRQSVQTNNPFAAEATFQKLETSKLSFGLHEKTLWAYAEQLVKQKRWDEVIRPYSLIAAKEGPLADDAKLRLGQIHVRITKRPELAIRVLESIIDVPQDQAGTSSAKAALMQKRNELLSIAKGLAAPQSE